jgi:hypothetical protein
VLTAGAVFSLREGIEELIRPGVTSSFAVAYAVLAVSAGFDLVSVRQPAGQMGRRARCFHRKRAVFVATSVGRRRPDHVCRLGP